MALTPVDQFVSTLRKCRWRCACVLQLTRHACSRQRQFVFIPAWLEQNFAHEIQRRCKVARKRLAPQMKTLKLCADLDSRSKQRECFLQFRNGFGCGPLIKHLREQVGHTLFCFRLEQLSPAYRQIKTHERQLAVLDDEKP